MRSAAAVARCAQRGIAGALALLGLATLGDRRPGPDVPTIPATRFVLSNGLVVVLSEDHATPIVTVDVWYHVGSKDEPPGRSGLAHLLEHMMSDDGSRDVRPEEQEQIIRGAGGTTNAGTHEDWTEYYETVPSAYLETVLWLESDRMATLLERMSRSGLDSARAVVVNERRGKVDNTSPASLSAALRETTVATLFSTSHPYHSPPMGVPTELASITLSDAETFFRTYYGPNDAVLVISGAFDAAAARRLVERDFASIPSGAPGVRSRVPPLTLAHERRVVLEDARATVPQIRIVWPGASTASSDRVALEALASLLTFDRTSRLRRALMYDRMMATGVSAQHFDLEGGGLFQLTVTPRNGVSLTEIERVVDSVVADIKAAPLSGQEIGRSARSNTVRAVIELQTTFARAQALAAGELFQHDPQADLTDIDRDAAVTPREIQRIATAYLTANRLVLSVVPPGKLESISRPELPYENVTPGKAGGSKQ